MENQTQDFTVQDLLKFIGALLLVLFVVDIFVSGSIGGTTIVGDTYWYWSESPKHGGHTIKELKSWMFISYESYVMDSGLRIPATIYRSNPIISIVPTAILLFLAMQWMKVKDIKLG
jgi:hypothetical protein